MSIAHVPNSSLCHGRVRRGVTQSSLSLVCLLRAVKGQRWWWEQSGSRKGETSGTSVVEVDVEHSDGESFASDVHDDGVVNGGLDVEEDGTCFLHVFPTAWCTAPRPYLL